MDAAEMDGLLTFLRSAERLKIMLRSSHTSSGRPESVAEHTWRLCLMAVLLQDEFPGLDLARLLSICVVHDLGEALHGDIPAVDQSGTGAKSAQERDDLLTILTPLPDRLRNRIVELWDEYEAAETLEARVAKALDKLETILQHNQGRNADDFNYAFNLGYGREYTTGFPSIVALREVLDRETQQHVEGRQRER